MKRSSRAKEAAYKYAIRFTHLRYGAHAEMESFLAGVRWARRQAAKKRRAGK